MYLEKIKSFSLSLSPSFSLETRVNDKVRCNCWIDRTCV